MLVDAHEYLDRPGAYQVMQIQLYRLEDLIGIGVIKDQFEVDVELVPGRQEINAPTQADVLFDYARSCSGAEGHPMTHLNN